MLSRSFASSSAGSKPTVCSEIIAKPPSSFGSLKLRGSIAADPPQQLGMSRHCCKIAGPSGDPELPCDRVHRGCKLDVAGSDANGIVGRQHHFHRLVNITPF